ncbi:hypothetical protein A6A04_02030 [Paramagnetospirillum marisnigri]|uniref:Lipoprotein n=1 Tax=Paramagnetospirillum marisnigri TaxID=1285242 RepID=A0A178MQ28_9PROT|nr:hypothetical protein [Paramagnetospirillum marisnigri]OAN50208.1 hypothetical protein A6A04_02030 [Paramagnetospirillum marisnigri]
MKHFHLVVVVMAALAATACQTVPPMQKLPEISFTSQRPFQLNVGQLEIVSEYAAPGRSPNIEHLMPVSPEAAIQRWAQDRLRPMGKTGLARVVIRDAKVVEVPLAIDKGVSGSFKKEQEYRYDAALDVAVQILDARQMVIGEALANATRSRTVPEGLSINQRDRIWWEITDALSRDIDEQLTPLIRGYLNRWVIQ